MRVPIKFTCNFTRIPTTNPTSPLISSIAKGVGQNSSPHQGFQTSLTVLLSVVTKYQIIMDCKVILFFHSSRLINCLQLVIQIYNTQSPKSIFLLFNIAPRKLPTPPDEHSSLYLRAFRCIFHTQKNRDIPFCFMPIIKTYEATAFCLTQFLLPLQLLATVPYPYHIKPQRCPKPHSSQERDFEHLSSCLQYKSLFFELKSRFSKH